MRARRARDGPSDRKEREREERETPKRTGEARGTSKQASEGERRARRQFDVCLCTDCAHSLAHTNTYTGCSSRSSEMMKSVKTTDVPALVTAAARAQIFPYPIYHFLRLPGKKRTKNKRRKCVCVCAYVRCCTVNAVEGAKASSGMRVGERKSKRAVQTKQKEAASAVTDAGA